MTVIAARPGGAPAAARSRAGRLTAAAPLLSIFLWLCVLYGWQAWRTRTAWFFYDELLYAELSRAIADTGHAGLRGHPQSFTTLYSFLLAPVWWIRSPQTAYETAKLVGVLAMSSVVFPAYGLARFLAPPRAALFAAAASAAIPSLAYSSLLLTEVVAYPFATLCFFLGLKAIVERRPSWIAAAVAASLVAPLVRSQLVVLPVALGISALVFAATSSPAHAWFRAAPRLVRLALPLAVVAVVLVVDRVIGHLYQIWAITTRDHPGRIVEYGLWSLGAVTIGVGVLPVVVALASLAPPKGRRWSDVERAFAAILAASVLAFALYTGVKTAYLGSFWGKRVEERNVIYLSPLFFAAAAAWVGRRSLRAPALVASAAAVGGLIGTMPITFDYPNIEALGLSLLAWANLHFGISATFAQNALLGLVAGSALAVLAVQLRPGALYARAGVAMLAALVLAWNVGGELAASDFSRWFAGLMRDSVPSPLDWVDRATGGADTVLLAHQVRNANGLHELEFWNRSIETVANVDGVGYPGPGPVFTATPEARDGALLPDPGATYAVAESGIEAVGSVVETLGEWSVVKLAGPLRLRAVRNGVFSDGWMGRSSSYSQYSSPGRRAGTLTVVASRTGWCGTPVGGLAIVRLGRLAPGPSGHGLLARDAAVTSRPLRSCRQAVFRLHTPPPPFRAEVSVTRTFVPAELDFKTSDRRRLGAQMTFAFEPLPAATGSRGGGPGPPARPPRRTSPRRGAPARA